MHTWLRSAVLAATLGSLASCASLDDKQWYQDAKSASTKAFNVASDSTSKALKRTQRYLAEQDVFMKFHDAGEHSEAEVLDVLHKAGIGRSKTAGSESVSRKGSGAAQVTRTRSSGKAGTTSPPDGPIQYAGALRWPVEAGIVSSKYGPRWGKIHKGLDIAADEGEPVCAIAGGDVIYAGDGLKGYGNVVIVQHDKQMSSLYAHNSALKVHTGDHVTQGSVLALLGNTGHSTGPHVHFEIREGDNAVDPMGVLPPSMMTDTREVAREASRQPDHDPRKRVAATGQ